MMTFFRQMGSTVGLAVVGSLFATTLSHQLTHRLAEATQGLPPDEGWTELRGLVPEVALPESRPLDEGSLTGLDAQLENAGAQAAEAAFARAGSEVKEEIDARRPKLFAAVDAAGAAVRESFTGAILGVYRVAVLLAVLALVLTLRLPQLPLK